MGRVIADNCDDVQTDAADGVQGVRVYMEDGTFRDYRRAGHVPRRMGFPRVFTWFNWTSTACRTPWKTEACEMNTRFAGTPWSQFVDLQGGTLWRADFHVKRKPDVDPSLPAVGKDITSGCRNPDDAGEAAPVDAAVTVEAPGLLAPADGSRLTHPINAVRVRLDARTQTPPAAGRQRDFRQTHRLYPQGSFQCNHPLLLYRCGFRRCRPAYAGDPGHRPLRQCPL